MSKRLTFDSVLFFLDCLSGKSRDLDRWLFVYFVVGHMAADGKGTYAAAASDVRASSTGQCFASVCDRIIEKCACT
jgi:hypothetical protein